METPFKSVLRNSSRMMIRTMLSCLIFTAAGMPIYASPDELISQSKAHLLTSWNFYEESKAGNEWLTDGQSTVVALSCLPEVNISLGLNGTAVITALTLVNAPEYPPHMYEVDIMGPLTNTVYCEQIGQELMVVVTELPTGNSCMSTIYVEDKLKPTLICTSDTIPCNTDIEDIDFESYIESVTDNCDEDPTLWYSYVVQNLPCNPHHFTQQILVTWTATDDYGNSTTCQDVIYLKKPALGQVVFPPNISISCVNADTDPSNTGEPTYNGEPLDHTCQLIVFKTDQVIPMCNGAQKILRLWTVKDWCNSGQVTHLQEILVVDDTPPSITCPANLTINTGPGVCTTKYTLPLPVVSDACANPNQIDIDIFVQGVPGIFSPGQMVNLGLGTTLITMRATDPCGNSSQCMYIVTVRDNTPPVLICPPHVTIECTESTDPSNTGYATAYDVCDNSPDITFTDVTVGVSGCALGYRITRTWKATDNSGNSITCMQMIELTDSSPPVISCPANVTINCTDSTNPAQTGSATATDQCDTSPGITFTDATAGGSCPQEYIITRTWIATDDCGNSATCNQLINVQDNTPPVVTCPPDLTIECSDSTDPAMTGTPTATDNCDPTVSFTFSDVNVPTGPQVYTINRTWTASDDCGNTSTCIQLILVHDDTPPVITCPANTTIACTASTLPGNTGTATATDNCDPSVDITYSDVTVGGSCPQEGTITRTWLATDDCGNTDTCIQIITIEDNTAPTISCPPNVTITCTASTAPANTGSATATDNCDLTPNISFEDATAGGGCPQEVTITRTWSATDDCGNVSTCIQIIVVDDSQAPVITCPANVTIQCTASTLPPATGTATASDLCDLTPDVTFTDATVAGDCAQEFTISRTWVATDDCGNASTCLQTISVVDTQAPAITCPANVTIACTDSTLPPATGTATATDNCNSNPVITFNDVTVGGSCPQELTITRTWTATDGCGNSTACIQVIVVDDSITPQITCPANVTIQCDESTLPANTGNPTVSDNCDTTPTVDYSDVTAGGGCPQDYTITRTWVATDDCGNSSTCIQTITVQDDVAPAVICPVDLTLNCDDSTDPESTGFATATDNCDSIPSVDYSDVTTGGSCEMGYFITRTWTAVDDCGNAATCIQNIEVSDNEAPLVSCPPNLTIDCAASTDPANTGSATSSDSCDPNPVISFADQIVSGSCPQEFTIMRTWTATDACGNAGTCLQMIVLDDSTAPVCQTQNITVSLNGSGMVTIQPSQVDNGSADDCGTVTLSVIPNSFNCDNLGANVVTLTVTDCPGNSSTCTAIVTIEDDGGLEAICQNVTIFVDANGNASVDPADVDNGSGGGCDPGDLEFDLSQTDFNCSDLGQNIVTLTVTDENGNTATCTAIITVVDEIPPAITCPEDMTVDCHTVTDPNNTAPFGQATATDNCPPAIITETHVIDLSDCNVGTITRTFTATDLSGNTATCIQIVTVTNPNPLDENDIDWPNSPVSVDICNSTDPEDIPNGEPEFDPTALLCADLDVSFSDVVETFIDNNPNTPCRVITRTWTVVDNCQPNGTFTFVQTINVQDAVPPVFTNINDMTKEANANCVAFFTLIASATDCAGVSITNNSPYGATTGANASGNYPIGVTVVIFTATDGCGNISTMDVVITVTDPNPTTFQCEKTLVFLPMETEITLPADTFVTIIEGGCTGAEDVIVSFSGTDPFDTLNTYDCGDVGVSTFPLWLWNEAGTMILDTCTTADLDLRDPTDFCMDGLVLLGIVENEDGYDLSGVEVSITNVQMDPDTTNQAGQYLLGGLQQGIGYNVAPYDDHNHREGVSTLDLVLIQKHLLGKAKLNSPYKIIAADANNSGAVTALDLLEIRKLILGITQRFAHNTSWRFVDRTYSFIDPYNPFTPAFPETIWFDSVTGGADTANFIAIKIGDVNGSYFLNRASGGQIKPRSGSAYGLTFNSSSTQSGWELNALPGQGMINGLQLSFNLPGLTMEQAAKISSDVLTPDQWYYNPEEGTISVSWSSVEETDLTDKVLLYVPNDGLSHGQVELAEEKMEAEAYLVDENEILIRSVDLLSEGQEPLTVGDYQLFQNIPNPFGAQTLIRYSLPQDEVVTFVVHDLAGSQVYIREMNGRAGLNEIAIRNQDLGKSGMYYYTLYTQNASFTRKMSFIHD